MNKLVLEYKRSEEDISYTSTDGCFKLLADNDELLWAAPFRKSSFEEMLGGFGVLLKEHPDAIGVIKRIDRANLAPFYLDPQTLRLFREDTDAAVKSMSISYGSPAAYIKKSKDRLVDRYAGLKVGHATLADAFGEDLYIKFDPKRDRVECPCCGLWSKLRPAAETYLVGCSNSLCAAKQFSIYTKIMGTWGAVKTNDLLLSCSNRFFFPRGWNTESSWVSWKDLNEKYNQFLKEKELCP